jgi:hypothetical protein
MGRYMELDPIALAGGFNGPFGPNWYGYAEGNPARYVDASGLASCSYSIGAQRLVCVGDRLPVVTQLGPNGVFSGMADCRNNPSSGCIRSFDEGPIVPGSYAMNPDSRPNHEGFWRLEPNPPVKGWEYYLRRKRSGFMLHPGSRSLGCITTDREVPEAMEQYSAVNELLWSELGTNTLVVTP